MPKYTPEQLETAVKNWNEKYPVGTPVRRYSMMDRSDEPTVTATRSAAWIMGGHSPMVSVEGFSGGMHLDQLEVIPEGERAASHIPPVEQCPPPPKPKRSGAFFPSDVASAADAVRVAAEDHADPEHFINAVIMVLQTPEV